MRNCFKSEDLCFLGLGGNYPKTLEAIKTSLKLLEKETVLVAWSSLYETEAQDYKNQANFLNCVLAILWEKDPFELLELTQGIENTLGRIRDPNLPKGPRILDIDILFLGRTRLTSPKLTIPHPGILHRRFVLEPLLELYPEFTYPGSQESLKLYLEASKNQGIYSRWPLEYNRKE